MKKVIYVVYGSEDGLLGCFGNVKAAYKCANDYVEGAKLSYAKVCSELKGTVNYKVSVNDDSMLFECSCDATITACMLNEAL